MVRSSYVRVQLKPLRIYRCLTLRLLVVFGRLPRMPLALELGLPLSNPSTVSEYVQSVRNVLQDIRQLARENLTQARAKQRRSRENRNPVKVWTLLSQATQCGLTQTKNM